MSINVIYKNRCNCWGVMTICVKPLQNKFVFFLAWGVFFMIFLSSCVVFDPNYEKKNVFCGSELKSELLRLTRRCLHGPLLLRG